MGEQVISKHEMNVWIPGCPVLIKELSIISSAETFKLNIISAACTDKEISCYTADIHYFNARRENIGTDTSVDLKLSDVRDVTLPNVAYAEAHVITVTYTDGTSWNNIDLIEGTVLPEQATIWQTDPLYKVIKAVTNGKVQAKYYPDTIDGGWRCACGSVNIEESQACGVCGCSREWLNANFDREYLESQKSVADEGKKPEPAKVIRKREKENRVSDKAKFILIVSSLLLAVILILSIALFISPASKYNKAVSLAYIGEYDKAISILSQLDYKNSADLIEDYTYEKFVKATGISDLYITTSVDTPWFEISDDGILEFTSSKYTGTFGDFIIPHVVNDIVVRELSKNFLINCTELETVSIPDTVEIIGEQAFYGCKSLQTVVFGKNVHTVSQRAFIDCTSLEEIVIPDTVTTFGQRMFNNCTSLKSVTLGSGVSVIGAFTFSNCPELFEITLNSPVNSIGEYALVGCNSLSYIKCNFAENKWIQPQVGEGNEKFTEITIIYK